MVSHLSLIGVLVLVLTLFFLALKREKKIKELFAYYKALFENQAQAVVIEEEDMTISLVNRKFEELSGYSKEEIEGKMKSLDFHPPGEREKILTYHTKRLRKIPPSPPQVYEVEFINKKGEVRYLQVYASIIPETKKVVAVLNDITEAKKAQEELKRTRDYLNKFIMYANSPIMVTDGEGRIILVNKAFEDIFGWKSDKVIGKNGWMFLPYGRKKEFERLWERISRGENLEFVETPLLTKKGEAKIILWNSASLFDDKGRLEAVVFQGQDITERKRAREELERAYRLNLRALTTALEAREHGTAHHCERVARYTQILAERMGLDDGYIKDIVYGALLHDIGKIGIKDSILLKPGKLTPEEEEEIKRHPIIGAKILEGIDYFKKAIEVVLYHHERWDGKGYPFGLSDGKIPLSARIFAVADALDAMTTNRPYRRKISFEEAKDEIKRCSGTQFDPKVVEVFLSIPLKVWQDVQKRLAN